MREVIFRGKRLDSGKWDEGYYVYSPYSGADGKHGIAYADGPLGFVVSEADPATIGQFTGLTDKNGKRIFEGDILDCGDRIVYVKWHEKCGQWDSEFIRYVRELSSNGITPVEWKFRAEKIGNIYDNPELLK